MSMPPTDHCRAAVVMTEDVLKQARILILDDDVATLCLLKSVLQRFGFTNVRAIDHPEKFAASFDTFQPDVVVTDLIMPQMDGFAVIEFIRGILPPGAWLPVLVCTANDSAQSRRRALAAGATDILVKPIDPSELLMRLRHVVRTRFLHNTLSDQNTALEGIVTARTSELESALAELRESQRTVLQQERFRAFGEMASGIVHDFNNALMTVIGYSELMLARPESLTDIDQVKDYLGAINTAGHDASHIVSRLREFYRPREKGEVFTAVDVKKMVEQAVKLTQPKWRTVAQNLGRNIEINFELETTPPVLGNETDLREVMTNLIFNAVDAMPKGGKITIRSRVDRRHVQLEVSDSGVGMTSDVRQRCLEPFFTTKGENGTGLGLSMVFGVIKRHDGMLDIESTVGKGTTIIVKLPVCDDLGTVTVDAEAGPMRSLNVLVVDDDPSARDVLAKYLTADGHCAVTVGNGAQAVRTFQQQKFDLLMTDQGMPGMNGLQLARYVRQLRANQPIILLTGISFDVENLPTEVDKVIPKPITPDRLRAALSEVIRV
jgi:signal transduction histidine kinase